MLGKSITKTIAGLLTLAALSAAHAGRHGSFPCGSSFNPSVLFPGQTVKNFITDEGATCNGVADDTAAITAFRAYAISQNPNCVVVFIPPGSSCNFVNDPGKGSFSFGGTQGATGASCVNVWAQGATLITSGGLLVGGQDFYEDKLHDAAIQQGNIGDNTVTLISSGDAAIFSVGDQIAVTGLELQECGGGCGFPPNFQYFETKKVTNISGSVISLSSPLTNQYLTTWPSVQSDNGMNNNGPARIYKMQPNWDVQYSLYGGTVTATTPPRDEDLISGRSVLVCDTVFQTTKTAPTVLHDGMMLRTTTNGIEVDKDIETLTMTGATVANGHNIAFQSPAPTNFYGNDLNITGQLNGTPVNATFIGGRVGGTTRVGPTGYGAGNSITFNGMATPTGDFSKSHLVNKSDMDPLFSGGTFTVPKSATFYFNFIAWAVPGHEYAFADSDGTLNSSPTTFFTIGSLVDNGTTISVNLTNCSWGSCSGSLPTPTCNSHACFSYVSYPAKTITQINKPAGSADLTVFAAP